MDDLTEYEQVQDMRRERDSAYTERNHLVAVLAKLYPALRSKTEIDGWDPAWQNIVYIRLPTGQVSYHFHDSDLALFAHVKEGPVIWDGHQKQDVHNRLNALTPAKDFIPVGEAEDFVIERQRLAYGCSELTANELRNIRFYTELVMDEFVKPRAYERTQAHVPLLKTLHGIGRGLLNPELHFIAPFDTDVEDALNAGGEHLPTIEIRNDMALKND
jgi:hypothetical protein